jgi:hypothetical protein
VSAASPAADFKISFANTTMIAIIVTERTLDIDPTVAYIFALCPIFYIVFFE